MTDCQKGARRGGGGWGGGGGANVDIEQTWGSHGDLCIWIFRTGQEALKG